MNTGEWELEDEEDAIPSQGDTPHGGAASCSFCMHRGAPAKVASVQPGSRSHRTQRSTVVAFKPFRGREVLFSSFFCIKNM